MSDILCDKTTLAATTTALQLTYGYRTRVDICNGMLVLRIAAAADNTLLGRDISKLHNYNIQDIAVMPSHGITTANIMIENPSFILTTAYLVTETIGEIAKQDVVKFDAADIYMQSYADTPEMLVYKAIAHHYGLLGVGSGVNVGLGSTIHYEDGNVKSTAILQHKQNFKVRFLEEMACNVDILPTLKLVEVGIQIYDPAFSDIVLWPASEMYKLIHDYEKHDDFGLICLQALIKFYSDVVMR